MRNRPALVGMLGIGVAVLLLALAFTRGGLILPGKDERLVTARFAATNQLRPGHSVRVDGVKVGTVKRISLDADAHYTNVQLAITDKHVALRADASAQMRWTTLLGGRVYIDLDPGTPARPALGARPITTAHTSSQVEFDDLTSVFSGSGLKNLQSIIAATRQGFSSPDALHRLLGALPPSLQTLRDGLTPVLGTESGDLRGLVAATGKTTAALGADTGALRNLVTQAAATTRATAAHRAALGASFEQLPASLDDTDRTAQRLDTTLNILTPLARQLRPGVRALGPTLRTLQPTFVHVAAILRDAKPLAVRLGPVLDGLNSVAVSGTPVVAGLKPTLARLNSELFPFFKRRDPDSGRRTIDMIGPSLASVASAGSEFDQSGNTLHFAVIGDERTAINLPCQTFVTDPSPAEKIRCDQLAAALSAIFNPPPRKGSR